LKEDPWKNVDKKYQVGQKVKGKVLKVNPFGAFVELDEDIHGLAHISELTEGEVEDPSDLLQVGETYEFNIISIEPNDHRLGLSTLKSKKSAKTEKGEAKAKAKAKETADEQPAEPQEVAADQKEE
jgi:ribosomal protein S1